MPGTGTDGYRGVRLGEARNPGPPSQLRRILASSSAAQPRRLVIVSQDLPPILRAASTEEFPATTVQDTNTEAHQIGTERDSLSDDTVSVGRASEQDLGEVVENDDLDDGRSDVGSVANAVGTRSRSASSGNHTRSAGGPHVVGSSRSGRSIQA